MKMRFFNRIDFHDADALLQNILVNKIEELKQTVNRNDFSELDAVFNANKEEQDAVCCEGHVHHGQQPGSGDSRGIADDRDHSMTIVKYHILTATREKLFLDEFWFSRMWAATVIEILFLFLTLYS